MMLRMTSIFKVLPTNPINSAAEVVGVLTGIIDSYVNNTSTSLRPLRYSFNDIRSREEPMKDIICNILYLIECSCIRKFLCLDRPKP